MEPATTDDTVTVIEQTNFTVSDRSGDMHPGTYHGYFSSDTRFLSVFTLSVGGKPPDPLAVGQQSHRGARFHLTNPPLTGVAASAVSITRERSVGDRLDERIRLTSHAAEPVELRLAVRTGADFADIFEVRGRRPLTRRVVTEAIDRRTLRYVYERSGFRRTTTVRFSRSADADDRPGEFGVRLARGGQWELRIAVIPSDGVARRSRSSTVAADASAVQAWRAALPSLETDDARLRVAWDQAARDLHALLLSVPDSGFIPAAGVPWYMAVFGRDAAITARQTMVLGPEIPLGTLRRLAHYQGRVEHAFREEQPGKIPHEVRAGELALSERIPHARYYGSVDSTPLFVTLFVEACRWSGWLASDGSGRARAPRSPEHRPPQFLVDLLPAVESALLWIDRYGTGADGLVWYGTRRSRSTRNQAWKDSADSYRFADGRIAEPPIAAVEVQGYVCEAKRGMADVYEALRRAGDAVRLRTDAQRLADAVDDAFWMPAEGTYAMGLDRRGRQIDSVTSNPGHLLWSGAARPERSGPLAERLLADDMFSGWGVRTMSSTMAAYNPLSYHNGSVWHHDNSLIAAGMLRYGHASSAWRVIDALLDAAVEDRPARLRELYAGYSRADTPELVPYPAACAPQAWAAGAVVLAVQTLLALQTGSRRAHADAIEDAPPTVRLTGARIGRWSGTVV